MTAPAEPKFGSLSATRRFGGDMAKRIQQMANGEL